MKSVALYGPQISENWPRTIRATVPQLGAGIILAEIHILQNVEMKMISITVTVRSAVLCMGTMGSCAVVPRANEPHNNLCMLYTA